MIKQLLFIDYAITYFDNWKEVKVGWYSEGDHWKLMNVTEKAMNPPCLSNVRK